MKKTLLATILALAFSAGAQAGTYVGSNFTVSYDDAFWGGTLFTGSGTGFSFADLGYEATTGGGIRGERTASYYDFGMSALTITANAGYKIVSITSGATGSVLASPGSAVDGFALASADTQSVWHYLSTPLAVSSTSAYFSNSAGEGSKGSGGAYNLADTASFAGIVTSAALDYSINGWVQAYRLGSSATATQDTAYFNVTLAPVPEPESYALLLAGLGVMATVVRRRARRNA